jgi:hypothetical protein
MMTQMKYSEYGKQNSSTFGQLFKMTQTKGILDNVLLKNFGTHLAKISKLAQNGEFYRNIA